MNKAVFNAENTFFILNGICILPKTRFFQLDAASNLFRVDILKTKESNEQIFRDFRNKFNETCLQIYCLFIFFIFFTIFVCKLHDT